MKQYFTVLILVLMLVFTFACDTSNETEPFGEWAYFSNFKGVLYEQVLSLNADGSYRWDYYEDSTKDEDKSNFGSYTISSKKGSLEINFVPDSETLESYIRNFMVTGGGDSLFIAEKGESSFVGISFLRREASSAPTQEGSNE